MFKEEASSASDAEGKDSYLPSATRDDAPSTLDMQKTCWDMAEKDSDVIQKDREEIQKDSDLFSVTSDEGCSGSDDGSGYGHILKYTSLFGGVQGVTVLLSIVRNKFIAILLGSFGVGLIDMYNKSMDLISRSTTFGLSFTAVRRLSELYSQGDRDAMACQVRVIRSWSVLTALLGFVVCAAFSPIISRLGFDTYDYTLEIFLLSPLVAMLAVTGGELAILKASRRLKQLAAATTMGAVATLFITVPFYYFAGVAGIVPALLLSTFVVMVFNLKFSLKLFPWHANPFSVPLLRKGGELLRQGVPYVLAGVVAAGAEMVVRAFIVNRDGLAANGLYCAGFMLTVSYARFVFTSMDADFYPRLSAICNNRSRMNVAINRQIEVCLLLITPFLICFALFLPLIIRLLFTSEFLKVVPMTLCASFYMFFKAVTTPVAYIPLAKGDSVTYFAMESLYYVFFILIVLCGYTFYGLTGAGIALSLSNLFDLLIVCGIYHVRYGYKIGSRVVKTSIGQMLLLSAGIYMAFQPHLWLKFLGGLPILFLSAAWSIRTLSHETEVVSFIRRKVFRCKH